MNECRSACRFGCMVFGYSTTQRIHQQQHVTLSTTLNGRMQAVKHNCSPPEMQNQTRLTTPAKQRQKSHYCTALCYSCLRTSARRFHMLQGKLMSLSQRACGSMTQVDQRVEDDNSQGRHGAALQLSKPYILFAHSSGLVWQDFLVLLRSLIVIGSPDQS